MQLLVLVAISSQRVSWSLSESQSMAGNDLFSSILMKTVANSQLISIPQSKALNEKALCDAAHRL